MAGGTIRERLEHKELKIFCGFSIVLLFLAGIVGMIKEGEGILSVFRGLWTIVISRDALITDYFGLAGYGAALMNAVLVMAMGLGLLHQEEFKFTGLTMAAVFINVGYGLWGKNPVNILPILLGASVYAKVHGYRLGRYLYTALFGTSLAPLVTELVYYFVGLSFVLPVVVGVLFTLLHALIQTYVLTMLTALYYGEVSEPSHKKEKKKKLQAENA